MMRKFVAILLLATVSGPVAALGLGKIELNSGLNQPFDARITLLSPSADEIQSLKVGLADSEAFRRAGIDRPFSLSKLNFNIEVTESGSDYIHITSDDPIREPYLNFLLEANWKSGRLFREYTVLLDPPMYDPHAGRMAPAPEPEPEMAMESQEAGPEPAPVREESRPSAPAATTTAEPEPSAPATQYSGGDYGPTVSNDTLWSIAKSIRPQGTSIQQMMLALLRANPEAFIDNNINGLRRGHVLRMPDESEIDRLNQSEALAEVKSQYRMWDEARGMMADRADERPVSSPAAGETADTTAADTGEDSELRVVTPEEGGGAGQTDTAGASKLRNDLAMANEQLESLSAENQDLQDRLSEAETIITDLQRLIELKDDELATLQQQLAASEAAAEEEVAASDEPAPEEAPVEEMATEPEPKPEPEAEEPAPASAGIGGIIATVRGMVMDNLMIIGGGLGLVVLAILALVMIRRRSAASSESGGGEVALADDFPDFDEEEADSEAATEMPAGSEDETDFNVEAEAGVQEHDIDLESTDEDRTMLAGSDEAETEEPEGDGEEEDPLAEVNVFLAYEHFDQAEEFVRDAINDEPENLEFHSKLLEVFYASGDKTKYEEEARVLNDLVNGEGEHWDMALAMWQEMSPNRALFEEPAEGEDEEDSRADTTGGGIVDLTSDTGEGGDDAGLDFDLGMDEEASGSGDDEETLDITTGADDEGSLERTASESSDDDDILDVTAAVGLDSYDDDDDQESGSGDDDNMFDIGGDDDSTPESSGGGDILDVSAGSGGGEDLLDVTAHSDVESNEIEEDLLDVTAATSAGADSEELLEVDSESGDDSDQGGSDNDALDFDIGGSDDDSAGEDKAEEPADTGSTADDGDSLDFDLEVPQGDSVESNKLNETASGNVIDFDSASGSDESEDDGGLSLDMDSGGSESSDDAGLSLDSGDDDQGLSFNMGDDGDDQGSGLSLDMDDGGGDDSGSGDDGGLELDFTTDDDKGESEDSGLSLEMESDDNDSSGVPDMDMESTVEIPKVETDSDKYANESTIEMDVDFDEDDDDDEDSTVFVPRSSETDEQSSDDEIATRLDLAKAYVELGDKDSAKPILEDVIKEGNDEQRQQAQEMMDQLS